MPAMPLGLAQPDTLFLFLQHSESPSPMAANHDRREEAEVRPGAGGSPAMVSPSADLAAQTGAMLIDNPSMRFNSPCHRFPSAGGNSQAGGSSQDLAPLRPPSRQHSSSEAFTSRAPSRVHTDPRQAAAASACVPQQMQVLQQPSSLQSLPSRGDNLEDQEWCADVANILPESVPQDSLRLHTSPAAAFHSGPVPLPPGSLNTVSSVPMMHVGAGAYVPAPQYWHPNRAADPLLAATAHNAHAADLALSSAQAAFLPALMMQRQQGQRFANQSSGQALANGGSAMEQLALSTAATADLLAGMAANSSQAHPHSASDLILAASASLQAFARAAQSTQGPFAHAQQGLSQTSQGHFSGQQGMAHSGNAAVNHSIPGFGNLPEHQRQQLAFMQQQWQMQQQQQQLHGWFGTNGA